MSTSESQESSGLPERPQDSRVRVLRVEGLNKAQRAPETESKLSTFRLLADRPQARLQTEGQDQREMEMVSNGPAGIREGKELCSLR